MYKKIKATSKSLLIVLNLHGLTSFNPLMFITLNLQHTLCDLCICLDFPGQVCSRHPEASDLHLEEAATPGGHGGYLPGRDYGRDGTSVIVFIFIHVHQSTLFASLLTSVQEICKLCLKCSYFCRVIIDRLTDGQIDRQTHFSLTI